MTTKILPYLKKTARSLTAAAVVGCALSSCNNSFIYDNEGDCEATYRVKFVYDRNMKWADAFASEVSSVHLYAFDTSGTLVWHGSEKGNALSADNYTMTLDLPAGDYRLLAWCGTENDGEREESFSVPQATVGTTRIEELQCRMRRKRDAAGAYSDEKLYSLFHGSVDVTLPDLSLEGGEYTCTVPLTKDTNHVRIILQHLSGDEVNPDDFTFRIEEENGLIAHNNELLSDETIIYREHDKRSGTAGLGINDYPEIGGAASEKLSTREITSVSVAIADLTISRLVEGRKTFLTVENKDGERVARIPLTDYALLLKDGYQHSMSDQEYLDRQDEYSLTFFLDRNNLWIGTSIIINSWKVVLNDIDFKS